VLVACSGGADSLALAAATAFVAPRLGLRAGLVSVDHGLQPGSAERASTVAEWGADIGLSPSIAVPVVVDGPGGPEAAARDARYQALAGAASDADGALVLLGHTRDDQAETVLLALARGAGPRGLAGMPARFVRYGAIFLRPFLDLTRATAAQLCAESGLTPWQDPHNSDPSYARARVRAALPVLVEALGPDLVDNLARTARLVAADLTALDELAEQAEPKVRDGTGGLRVEALAALAPALRGRLLRRYTRELGVSGSALSSAHLDALDALVTAWHGQGPVALPGGIRVARVAGCLRGLP
jgi:tRNA(Ile)-lysidine synthase